MGWLGVRVCLCTCVGCSLYEPLFAFRCGGVDFDFYSVFGAYCLLTNFYSIFFCFLSLAFRLDLASSVATELS